MESPRNILLSGSYSVGKTTVFNELKKDANLHAVPDGARVWLEKNGLTSNGLTVAQKITLQEATMKYYVDQEVEAMSKYKVSLTDSSLVEVYAYSQHLKQPELLNLLDILVSLYSRDALALVFPPTIRIENDNLRHTDSEFRIEIHTRIMQLLKKHSIPFTLISGSTIQDRIEEVRSYLPSPVPGSKSATM